MYSSKSRSSSSGDVVEQSDHLLCALGYCDVRFVFLVATGSGYNLWLRILSTAEAVVSGLSPIIFNTSVVSDAPQWIRVHHGIAPVTAATPYEPWQVHVHLPPGSRLYYVSLTSGVGPPLTLPPWHPPCVPPVLPTGTVSLGSTFNIVSPLQLGCAPGYHPIVWGPLTCDHWGRVAGQVTGRCAPTLFLDSVQPQNQTHSEVRVHWALPPVVTNFGISGFVLNIYRKGATVVPRSHVRCGPDSMTAAFSVPTGWFVDMTVTVEHGTSSSVGTEVLSAGANGTSFVVYQKLSVHAKYA